MEFYTTINGQSDEGSTSKYKCIYTFIDNELEVFHVVHEFKTAYTKIETPIDKAGREEIADRYNSLFVIDAALQIEKLKRYEANYSEIQEAM